MASHRTRSVRRVLLCALVASLAACSPAPSLDPSSSPPPPAAAKPDPAQAAASASSVPVAPAAPRPLEPCDGGTLDLGTALRRPGLPVVSPEPVDGERGAWSTVSWLACGEAFPVFTASAPPRVGEGFESEQIPADVYGAILTADREWLFVVQLGRPSYGGAIAPLGLGLVEITAVELRTAEARRLATRRQHESTQSLMLAYDGSTLALQWRYTGGTDTDERLYERCELSSRRCESVATAPSSLRESADVLEVTMMGTYAGRPAKAEQLGRSDVLARSVRTSEGGAYTAFVTDVPPDLDEHRTLPPRRTLWVLHREAGASRAIASGRSLFEPVWVSEHELVYRPEVEPLPELASTLAALEARVSALGPPEAPPELRARQRSELVRLAAEERARDGLPVDRLLRFALRKYDAHTGKDVVLLEGPVAPFGTPSRPDLHHKGRTREVGD